MDKFNKFTKRIKDFWKTRKLQHAFRLSYDVGWNIILFFIIVGVVAMFFAIGTGAGYFASLVKDEPIRSHSNMEKDIYNYEETSKLYFADEKKIGDVNSDVHRDEVKLDDVSDSLINAVIATEDANFKTHKGVVPKAIVRAIIQEATNSDLKTGGSTLTQQLIKNQILTNEVSFDRKAKEILLSLRLERFFSKDQILEAYLNIIPYGRDASGQSIAGIQTASQGIFGIDASELNLPQSAYLAGLPQSPSFYTPFLNNGDRKEKDDMKPGIKRMKSVLKRMYDKDYITKDEYEEAADYDIADDFIKAKESSNKAYPFLTDEIEHRATKILMEKEAKEDGYTKDDLAKDDDLKEKYSIKADRNLRQNGYHINSTIDKETYNAFQKIVKEYDQYGPDKPETVKDEDGNEEEVMDPVQVGGALIENNTGRIISFIGGRDYEKSQVNHISDNALRPNGSTMKPLLVYGPAMEKGIIQPGSPILDYKIDAEYSPPNYAGGYHGIVSAREALANSYNIPTVKIYKKMLDEDPASEYLEKMGISTLTKEDHGYESLALGQPTNGINIEENINAFTTFGNDGDFNESYMIDSITTSDGDVIYEHEDKDPTDVFSPQTNYLTLDMMRDVIKKGTASYLNSQLNQTDVDWAGKTGTSQNWEDTWFVATNPNVTFGTWMGYDSPKSLKCESCSLGYSDQNVKLWGELVNKAAEINPDLVAPQDKFEKPDDIESKSFCEISGKLPDALCKKADLVKTDIFNSKYAPTEKDDSLIQSGDGFAFNPDFLKRKGYDKYNDLSILYPRTNRDKWEKIKTSKQDSSDSEEDDSEEDD